MRRYVKAILAVIVLSLIISGVFLHFKFAENKNTANGNGIEYFTLAYDTFKGFDWFIDTKTHLSMGIPKYGVLSDVGLKIHSINPDDPEPWDGGEFYCDPDSVILVSSKTRYEVAYDSYLNWQKDYFIRPDKQFVRISSMHDSLSGLNYAVKNITGLKTVPLKLDIRQDHSLEAGKPWVRSTIYITNRYSEPVDILYFYQDAAYMWLPDQTQKRVRPLVVNKNLKNESYYFIRNSDRTMVAGTFHSTKGYFGGLFIDNPQAYLGVIPEYALFRQHKIITQLDKLGYADIDNSKKSFAEILNYLSQWNGKEATPPSLKVRVLAIPFIQVPPGETVATEFYRIGLHTDKGNSFGEWVTRVKNARDLLVNK